MDCEKEKLATDFLDEREASCTIRLTGQSINSNWGESFARNVYHVTLSTPRGQMSLKFWDSLHNLREHLKPTPYDVMSCLTSDDPESFEDFCSEFGYDPEFPQSRRTYNACVREYADLTRIFTQEQLEKLREIQ